MSSRFGVIGNGVVGSLTAKWFGARRVYDILPERSPNTLAEVLECETIFLCPYLEDNASILNLGQQSGFLVLAQYLKAMPSGTTVVIRSTVVPGTCDRLQSLHPHVKVLFCPEFLTERNAGLDFQHPHLLVVGGDPELAMRVAASLPRAPATFIPTTTQAEWLKLALAGYLALKVSFFNQLLDAIPGDDFEKVHEMMTADYRVGHGHSDPLQDGYRGWGGKCFTKDVPCFAEVSGMSLVKEAVRYNRELREREQ